MLIRFRAARFNLKLVTHTSSWGGGLDEILLQIYYLQCQQIYRLVDTSCFFFVCVCVFVFGEGLSLCQLGLCAEDGFVCVLNEKESCAFAGA